MRSRRPTTSATSVIAARTATARWIERCSVNTTAHATKTHASAQANDRGDRACPQRSGDGQRRAAARRTCRRRAAGTRSSGHGEQRAGVAGREEANAVAVLLTPQQQRPQPQRPRAAGGARARPPSGPLCLARKRRWPRRFSTYSCPPCEAPPTCTTSAPREEQHLPAGPAEARQPVDLLAEHEEVLVEQPDRVGGLAADEQRRAVEPVDLGQLVVREVAAVERVQEARVRSELADEQVLRREAATASARRAPTAAACRRCSAASGRRRPPPDARRRADEPVEPVAEHPGIRVEQEEVAAVRRRACRRCCRRPCPCSPARSRARRGSARARRRPCSSVEPLSTTITSRPRTESRHCSSHGSAFQVTTTTRDVRLFHRAPQRSVRRCSPRGSR